MEVIQSAELTQIDEVRILSNVRLISRNDLNHLSSKDNLRVQFDVSGELRGTITSYLCLDNKELTDAEKNYLYPLFTETMNILLGRQISTERRFVGARINLSAPKISLLPVTLSTRGKSQMQRYELELSTISFTVLVEYSLAALN